uniref:DDE-1 domain-containing protein n=1 Tax=Acrobeloides nanus TaxID=290746 RepID=A0A914DNZ1_9BILA
MKANPTGAIIVKPMTGFILPTQQCIFVSRDETKSLRETSLERGMLKRALKKAWNEITLETLVKIVDNFPKRLKACVDAKGGHFE